MWDRARWLAPLVVLIACGPSAEQGGPEHDAGGGDSAGACVAADSDALAPAHTPLQEPPPNPVGGFSIDLGDPAIQGTELQPGAELFPCVVFPLTIQGPSNLVGGGMMTTSPGLHHGNITTRPSDGMPGIHNCPNQSWSVDNSSEEAVDVLSGGAVLFGSTTQVKVNEWQSFPCGMAYAVKPGYQIVANMHYLNPTSVAITPKPKYEWFTIDPKALTQQLYPFAWELSTFTIAPNTTQTVTGSCALASPMHVVNVLPHMHRLGTGLDLTYLGGPLDGKAFLTSPGYDPDGTLQVQYTPAVDLGQGTGFTMACTWDNTTDQTVVEGTGNNEMCIIFGYGWPETATYSTIFSAGGTSQCLATIAPSN
jgi:hypothetical protein